MRHHDVLTINSVDKLFAPVSEKRQEINYYCAFENLFDILSDVHKELAHGGRDRMKKEVDRKYQNITGAKIKLILNLCKVCQEKRLGRRKGLIVKPILSPYFTSRCQIELMPI